MSITTPTPLPAHIAARLAALPRVGSREVAVRSGLARRQGIDVLTLTPYPTLAPTPQVVAAVQQAMNEDRETPSQGLPALCQAVADQVGADLGRVIDPATEVLITNGAMQALNIVFRTILDPGDEVIVPAPCYYFEGCIELAGGATIYVPMAEESGYVWDLSAIERAISARTRALIVSTPVNPTGYVLTRAEVEALAVLALRYKLILVADESYDRLVYDGRRHESIAAIPTVADRTLLIKSLTKSYAMPAWRVGYIVGPAAYITYCVKALEWELLHCNHVAQAAAAAAMTGPQEALLAVTAHFQRARDHLLGGLAAIQGVTCVKPQGGPFLFLNIAQRFASSQAAADALLAVGVPTVPGWYCQSDAHVRLAMGATPQVLDEVLRRLAVVAAAHTP